MNASISPERIERRSRSGSTSVSIFCLVKTTLLGTHEAFVGEVFDIVANDTEAPIGWVDGGFAHCRRASETAPTSIDTDTQSSPARNGTSP